MISNIYTSTTTTTTIGKGEWLWTRDGVDDHNTNLSSRLSNATCTFVEDEYDSWSYASSFSPATFYFRETLRDGILHNLTTSQECDLAVYTAAFDKQSIVWFYQTMRERVSHSNKMLSRHGSCFFLFTSTELQPKPTFEGHFWVIPIPSRALPYSKAIAQNVNFIKYSFPILMKHSVPTLIWQDAQTFFSPQHRNQVPHNYDDVTTHDKDVTPCVTAMSLPVNIWTVGRNALQSRTSRTNSSTKLFEDHCQFLSSRFCNQYKSGHGSHSEWLLDSAMISTQWIVWNTQHEECRKFHSQLQCTVLDELHRTESSFDTVVFPYVSSTTMNVEPQSNSSFEDDVYNRNIHELDWFDPKQERWGPMMRIVRNNCHWGLGMMGAGSTCHYWTQVKRQHNMLSLPSIPFEPRERNQSSISDVVDYKTCTSPERNVVFPLQGDTVVSHTVSNNRTSSHFMNSSVSESYSCGLKANNPFSRYLKDTLRNQQLQPLVQSCPDMVVFGVAFGDQFVRMVAQSIHENPERSHTLIDEHGKCFILFVAQQDMPSRSNRLLLHGHVWFTPIPEWVFPYRNARRNAKLIKYIGHSVFPNVQTIIWQDAKFFQEGFQRHQPDNYWNVVRKDNNACLTAYGLPVSKHTMGDFHPSATRVNDHRIPKDRFQAHCNTVVKAIARRPNVTDSIDSVTQQCMAYYDHTAHDINAFEALSRDMVDTAFMIWNHRTEACRGFGNAFRCILLDQIHCHSDRDQISFPFTLSNQFDHQTDYFYETSRDDDGDRNDTIPTTVARTIQKPLDDDWNPAQNDLLLVRRENHPYYSGDNNHTNQYDFLPLVRIVRQSCHWYYKQLGSNYCKLS